MIFRLKAPRHFSPALIVVITMALALSAWSFDEFQRAIRIAGDSWPLLAILVALIVVVPFAVAALVSRRPEMLEIALQPRGVVLPVGFTRDQVVELPYPEIDLLLLLPGAILIGSAGRRFVYPVSAFLDRADVARLKDELDKRIGALPDGSERLRAMDLRARATANIASRPIHATKGVLLVLVICFALEYFAGANRDPSVLLRMGAGSRALIAEGELFRVVSANFLHDPGPWPVHILLNSIAILSLGVVIERLLGTWSFLIIYLLSALAGAGASAAFSQGPYAVGASTAAFGLFGSLAYTSWHFRATMPAGFKQPLGWWVIIIGLNLALSIWVPRIDSAAHGGGFIAGLLVTGIIVGAQDRLPLPRPNSLSRVLPALLLMGVAIGGLADAARNYMNPDPRAFVKAVEPWVGAPNLFPDELNRYAWEVGTDGGTDEPALRRAREAAERAMDEVTSDLAGMDPRDPQIQALKSARLSAYGDTRATLLYRLGELDQAIEVERSVLEREAEDTEAAGEPSNEGFYATQLARFMRAKNRRDRPPAEARLWIPDGGNAIAYEMAAASEKPVTLYAVAETGGRLEGLVRIPAAAGTFTGTVAVELPWKHASIELGTISPAEHAPRVWPADPEALKLP